MVNISKLSSLFEFLADFSLLGKKQLFDINQAEERFDFFELKPNKHINIFYGSTRNEGDENILALSRINEVQGPNPHCDYTRWIIGEWDNLKDDVIRTKKAIPNPYFNPNKEADSENEELIFFKEDIDIEKFSAWEKERNEWLKIAREINDVNETYDYLYNLYRKTKELSDTHELKVGTFMLETKTDKARISHPFLTRKARIVYDIKTKEISVRMIPNDTKVETYLLSEVPKLNLDTIGDSVSLFEAEDHDPLNYSDTLEHLKLIINALTPSNTFVSRDQAAEFKTTDELIVIKESLHLILKPKEDRSAEYLNEVSQSIRDGNYPEHMMSFVDTSRKVEIRPEGEISIAEKLANLGGESKDILLAKEANEEQLNIIKRLDQGHDGVLVQGPPGTGKTHTIANIAGHFLSQGKTVLITSHTRKALSVLKEKLPLPLQPLAVSLVDDTNNDMEKSVDHISEFIASNTSDKLSKNIEALKFKRNKVIDDLTQIRETILAIKVEESSPVVIDGKEYKLSSLAKKIRDNEETLNIIPGKVKEQLELPVTIDDLELLYKTNASFSKENESEFLSGLINPSTLIKPTDFNKLTQLKEAITSSVQSINTILGLKLKFDDRRLVIKDRNKIVLRINDSTAVDNFTKMYESTINWELWNREAIIAGKKGSQYLKIWEDLIDLITTTKIMNDENVEIIFNDTIYVPVELITIDTIGVASEMKDIISSNIKLKLKKAMNKKVQVFMNEIKIDGKEITSVKELEDVITYIEMKIAETKLEVFWQKLLGNFESVEASYNTIKDIRYYLNWYAEYLEMKDVVSEGGLNFDLYFGATSNFSTDKEELEIIVSTFASLSKDLISLSENLLALKDLDEVYEASEKILDSETESKYNLLLRQAIRNYDVVEYEKIHTTVASIYDSNNIMEKRKSILATIKMFAPKWAQVIEARDGIHGLDTLPDQIEVAWEIKQYSIIIDNILKVNYSKLLQKSYDSGRILRDLTGELAAQEAWLHLLNKTQEDKSLQHSLQSWKMTMKKIGKGTGKRAPKLRKEAQQLMKNAQKAIPTWIMPMDQVINNMSALENSFDIVIVDEASQSSLTSLGVLFLGQKVIVVGDDKQVSPTSMVALGNIETLIEKHLMGKDIPSTHLYDGSTSIYDLAQLVYEPLMLKEHFRCVPEIINFSSYDSYDGKIKALRGSNTAAVYPPLVEYRVKGTRNGSKENTEEAKAIAALIYGMTKTKEYDGLTIGVITMITSKAQEIKIMSEISKLVSSEEIETRNIVVGNADSFQGDERHVMFLSLIDSNDMSTPMRIVSEGRDDMYKKRYNVAVSRAQDQLWVIHSLDVSKDLKEGDYRKKLIEHTRKPKFNKELIQSKSDSVFEEEVVKALIARGFNIEQQKQVGSYRIDMIATDGNKEIAIECDGERYHSSPDQIANDLERQTVLERVGWKFIRLRGSEYFRNPALAIDRVTKDLLALGIEPNKGSDYFTEGVSTSNELLSVKKHAYTILEPISNTSSNQEIYGINDLEVSLNDIKPSESGHTPVQKEINTIIGDIVFES